jgi:hypothetical protein
MAEMDLNVPWPRPKGLPQQSSGHGKHTYIHLKLCCVPNATVKTLRTTIHSPCSFVDAVRRW